MYEYGKDSIYLSHVIKQIREVSDFFRKNSKDYDETGKFPHENFDLIVLNRLHDLTIPYSENGKNFNFEELSKVLIDIGSACPSTALCLAMHYYTVAGLSKVLSSEQQKIIFNDIVTNGHFIASFNLPNIYNLQFNQNNNNTTGVEVKKVKGGYIINGTKKIVSGSPRFKYIPIYADHRGLERSKYNISAFFVTVEDTGVEVLSTWNSTSMKPTCSNDVKLNNVFVDESRLIGREGFGIEDTPELVYWSRLAISSVYLGLAKTAVDYVVEMLKEKKDRYSCKILGLLPGPQFSLSEMKIYYENAMNQLIMYSKQADAYFNTNTNTNTNTNNMLKDELFQTSLITKFTVSTNTNKIILKAMQIEGMSSMNQGGLLERLNRDSRASLFHQPSADLTKEILAKKILGLMPKNRW